MTAATYTNYKPPWLLLFIAAILVTLAVVTQLNFHALLRHGSDAEQVRQNCNNGHEVTRGFAPDGKIFRVCLIEPEKYGIQVLIKNIDGTFREITSFIYRKEKGATFQQVIDYLTRQGVTIK